MSTEKQSEAPSLNVADNAERRRAWTVIVMFGVVSLFSDMTYQAGRSLQGPFLAVLGANAALVGFVAGLGEFLGYAARLLTGIATDRSKAYWFFTIAGYAMLAVVPLMSLAGTWQAAALFIFLERLSKAVRAPAKDTILSMAARRVGTGNGFGLHKIMDQFGAILGPVLLGLSLSGVFGTQAPATDSGAGGLAGPAPTATPDAYRAAYLLVWIPFALTIAVLIFTRFRSPDPRQFETRAAAGTESGGPAKAAKPAKLPRGFWVYSFFTLVNGMGFVNFTLLAFHAQTSGAIQDADLAFWYAVAMGANGVAGFFAGRIYEKAGLRILYLLIPASVAIPVLGFAGNGAVLCAIAVVLWGAATGLQETIVKSGIADLVPVERRGAGYGIFNTVNGFGLLASGAIMGLLYEFSILSLCVFVVVVETAALFVLRRVLADKARPA